MKVNAIIILTLLTIILILNSCYKNDEPGNCNKTGEIIFYEYKECLCCPGWVIKIGNDTIKTELLPNQEIVMDEIEKNGFPISILLEYKDTTGICNLKYKKITCLEIIKN